MPRVARFDLYAVDLPFRRPFTHAAARRRSSESLLLRCVTEDGAAGFGEALPRPYVTGETRDGVFDLLRERVLPRLLGADFASLDDVRGFLRERDGAAPHEWVEAGTPQAAAWCAVDLALLDAAGRSLGEPVRLGDGGPEGGPGRVRYSAVISADAGLSTLLKIRLAGIRQVKLKVGRGDGATRRARRWLGRRCDLRVDANMAWDVETALKAMRDMARDGVRSFEQPLAADDLEGLSRLVREGGAGVMADESLRDRASLAALVERRACTAVNVRISKCGGLVAALARCREALEAGLAVQVGCQVGESSLLSAAHLVLVSAVREVTYAEGCFGRLLLREDPFVPVLQFGYGGRPPALPDGPGLGVRVDERTLERWTTRAATVRA